MKILRLIYDWPPPWAGLVAQPYEITRFQQQAGHDVTIMCGRWPKAGDLETLPGVEVIPTWRAPLKGTVFFTTAVILFFRYLMWRRKNTPDVIHCHGHFGYWIMAYRKFLHKIKPWHTELEIPFVYHYHITYKGRWEHFKKSKQPISFLAEKIEWPLMVKADKIASEISSGCIFTSEDVKLEAIRFYEVNKEKCFVVETGVNTRLFRPVGLEERDKTRKDLGLDELDKVILNYGMLVERKNIHLLVESLKFLSPAYKLLLIGPDSHDKDYVEKLNELINVSHLQKRVVRVGYTPYPQIPIGIQACDVFVLPSDYEGMPKVVLESLACGKPVLASGFKLSREVQGLYYFKSKGPQDIARQIEEILSEGVIVDKDFVAQNYSWVKKVKQIDEVYQYALEHKVI